MKVLALIFCLVAYSAAQTGNVVEEATNLGATELVRLLNNAGLVATLNGTGPFTVFAPTNEAFSRLPPQFIRDLLRNKTLLTEFLTFHVVTGSYKTASLKNDELLPSLFVKHSIRINIYTPETTSILTADGSRVITPDKTATNGVVQLIDRVLFAPEGTITDLVTRDPVFKTLLEGVTKANLGPTLAGAGPFTFFAPTDEAFRRLPNGTWDKLLANVTALTAVLDYHLVKGTDYSDAFKPEQDVPTVEGKTVHVRKQGYFLEVNRAHVELANLAVDNGVVHIISEVLIPPSIKFFYKIY